MRRRNWYVGLALSASLGASVTLANQTASTADATAAARAEAEVRRLSAEEVEAF